MLRTSAPPASVIGLAHRLDDLVSDAKQRLAKLP